MTLQISQEEEARYAELQAIALDFAREGNTNELSKMIDAGMNVNLCTHKEDSLLMLASYNGNYETTEMLIDHNADLNRVNQREQTPLEGVCFKGDLNIVKLLVQNGANFEGKAIIYASMFGHIAIVEYLQTQELSHNSQKFLGVKVEKIASFTSYLKGIKNKLSF